MPTSRAARSGNPAKRATSSAADFKKKSGAAEIELPSGNIVAVRRLGLTTLLSEGILGDELTAIAQKAIESGKGLPPDAAKEMARDPKKIAEMMRVFDDVTVRCWRSPVVHPVVPETERDEELLYVDELELDDKIFTFNFVCGGSSDLTTFRQQLSESMEGVPAGEGVALPPE